MKAEFTFETAGDMFFGKVSRPVAQVAFRSPKEDLWISSSMLVDTGADFSILPKYLSQDLLISLEKDCKLVSTKGIGGEQGIYLVKKLVEAKVGEMTCQVPLAFFSSDEMPPILGRMGFMDHFNVSFLTTGKIVFEKV